MKRFTSKMTSKIIMLIAAVVIFTIAIVCTCGISAYFTVNKVIANELSINSAHSVTYTYYEIDKNGNKTQINRTDTYYEFTGTEIVLGQDATHSIVDSRYDDVKFIIGGVEYDAGDSYFLPDSNVIIEQDYHVVENNVTYDYATNGGQKSQNDSSTSSTVVYNIDESIDLTETAYKSGATFIGWNTTSSASTGLSSLTMGSSDITLFAIYSEIDATPDVVTLDLSGTDSQQITISGQNYGTVTYSSSDPSVATVSNTGLIQAVGNGTATITVTGTNGSTVVTDTITVTVVTTPTGISLANATELIGVESGYNTVTLNPTITPATANSQNTVTYTSDATSIATVSSAGVVTGVADGVATVTATTANGQSTTVQVTVDGTAPTVAVTMDNNNYANSHTATITITDNVAGLPANQSIQYAWSTDHQTAPTSWTTVATTNAAGATSTSINVTKNDGSGEYYLWVKAGVEDTLANATTDYVSSVTAKLDNTAPLIEQNGTASPTSASSSSTIVIPIKITDVDAGINTGNTSTALEASDIVVKVNGTVVTPSTKTLTYEADVNGVYTYHLTLEGVTGTGPLTLEIAADSVEDLTGNPNVATTINTGVTMDANAFSCTITASENSPTNASSITYTYTFNKDTADFTQSDIALTNGTITSFTAVSGSVYEVVVTNSGTCTQQIGVVAGACHDGSGNPVEPVTPLEIEIDTDGPVVTIVDPNSGLSYITVERSWSIIGTTQNIPWNVTATDTGSGVVSVEYVLDSSSATPSSGWTSLTNGQDQSTTLGLGAYYIHVKATDNLGNVTYVTTRPIRIKYSIQYYDCIAGSTSLSQGVDYSGTPIIVRTPGTYTGYSFEGWYTARTGGTKVADPGDTLTPTSGMSLYGHWTKLAYAEYEPGNNTPVNHYATLQEAFAGATSGNTIKPELASITDESTSSPTIPSGKTLTLDLETSTVTLSYPIENSGTLTVTGTTGSLNSTNCCIYNENAGTVTVNGGTLQTTGMGVGHIYSVIDQNSTGTVTINNGTIVGNDVGIAVNSSGKVTVNNGTITSIQDDAIHCYDSTNQLEVNDGTISGETCGICCAGTIDILGGTIESDNIGVYVTTQSIVTIGEDDGTVTSGVGTQPSITGGNHGINRATSNATLNIYDGIIIGQSGAGTAIDGYGGVDDVPTGYGIQKTLAIIGGVPTETAILVQANYAEYNGNTIVNYYETLEAAFECATSGNTIKPLVNNLNDASAGTIYLGSSSDRTKSLKLDLQGYTINLSKQISNYGTLDIYSSVDGGTLNSEAGNSIVNIGTFTTNATSSSHTMQILNLATTDFATVLDNAGTARLNSNSTLKIQNPAASSTRIKDRFTVTNEGTLLEVNGATIINNASGVGVENGYSETAIANVNAGTNSMIVINSGTIEASGYTILNNGSTKNTTAEPAIKIAGGEVKSTDGNAIKNIKANSMIYITGGTISRTTTGTTSKATIETIGNFTMTGGTVYAYAGSGVTISGNGVGTVSGGLISKEKNPVTNAWISGACFNTGSSASATLSGTAVLQNKNGNGSNVIYNGGIGTITVDGATVQNLGSVLAGTNHSSGKIIVKSGTVTSAGGIILQNDYASSTSSAYGTIEVQGGTLSTTGTTGISSTSSYGRIIVSGGEITSAGNNGTIYNTAENAQITVTGGTVTATASNAIHSNVATSTVTIGDSAAPVTSVDDNQSTEPRITGGIYGVTTTGAFNFYDGVIKGASSKSISKNPDGKPTGYTVRKTTANGIETAVLGNTYTVNYYVGKAGTTGDADLIGTQTVTYGTATNLTTWANLGGIFPYSTADHNANSSHTDYNWTFAGWNTTTSGTARTYTNGQSYTHSVENDINLYAVGSKQFVFYSGIAPTASGGISTQTQYWNPYSTATSQLTSISIPSPTAISSWTFKGYKAGDNTANSSVTFAASTVGTTQTPPYNTYRLNRSVYSRTLTINYNANGGTGTTTATTAIQYYNSGRGTGSANNGANVSTPSFTLRANGFTRTGYSFSKWADGSTSGTQYAAGATYNAWTPAVSSTAVAKTMYAIWTINTYTITYNANNIAQAYKAGTYLDTGFKPDWSKNFTLETTLKVSALGKRYLVIGNYNGSDTAGLSIEINADNTLRVYLGAGGKDKSSTATITANEDIKVTFSWNASTSTYTATAVGTATNISLTGTYTMSGTSANGLRIGGADYRTGTNPFNTVTAKNTKMSKPYTYGVALGALPAATRTGYTFNNWYTAASGGTQISASTTVPAANTTYYAHWTANKYKVTLNNQNANTTGTTAAWYYFNTTATINSTTVYYYSDEACTTPLRNGYSINIPTKSGFTFGGYYTAVNGGGTQYVNASGNFINNIYSTVAGDTTLYAKWTEKTYTLTVKPNGGTYNNTTSNTTYTLKYSDVQNIPDPTRSGYTFTGWSELSNGMTTDPSFSTGTNGVGKYANQNGAQVTVTRQAKSSDNPIGDYELKITNAGGAATKPQLGGFIQNSGTVSASQKYIHLFVAKLPVGYYFQQANNNMGTGATITWLTPQEGTGSFETYAYQVNTGSTSGSNAFSNFGHVFVSTSPVRNANAATGSYTAYLAYSNIFNITNDDTGFGMIDGTGVLTAGWTNGNYAEYNGTVFVRTYDTLAEALSGATSGRIIKPLKDLTDASTENPTIVEGKKLTIDTNGYTVTMSKQIDNYGDITISGSSGVITSSTHVIKSYNAKVKVTGGELVSTSVPIYNEYTTSSSAPIIEVTGGTIRSLGYSDAIAIYYNVNNAQERGSVTVSGGTIQGGYGIYTNSSMIDVVVTGGTITGTSVTGIGPSPGSITISGNPVITGHDHSIKSYYGVITVNGGTLTNTSSATVYGKDVTITGGTISNTSTSGSYAVYSSDVATITGGTITSVNSYGVYATMLTIGTDDGIVTSVDNTTATEPRITGRNYGVYILETLNFYDGVIKATDGIAINRMLAGKPTGYEPFVTVSGTQHTAILAPVSIEANYAELTGNGEVAAISYYSTLSEAFSGATSGNTIKLLKNNLNDTSSAGITIGSSSNTSKSLKFNLAGNTVNLSKQITNYGTLDIYSSVNGGTLNTSVTNGLSNYGTMTFNNTSSSYTTLVQYTGTALSSRVLVNQTGASATVRTKATLTFTQAQDQGSSTSNRYLITNYGTFTLSGGSLINNLSSTTRDLGILNYHENARIIIALGTLSTYGIGINNYSGTGNTTSTPAIRVSGGSITSSNSYGIYNQKAGMIYVSSGTVSGTNGIYNTDSAGGIINVTGGTITGTTNSAIRGYSGTVTISGSSTKVNGTTYGVSATTGSITMTGGTVTASNGVGLYTSTGSIIIGTNDSTVTSIDNTTTTEPRITGSTYGVQKTDSTTGHFHFFDGVIKGATSQSMNVNPDSNDGLPTNYGVYKSTANNIETAILTGNYAEYNGNTLVGYYPTLESAYLNVTAGNTIKVLKNITNEPGFSLNGLASNVTLDLNGKTITLQSEMELTFIKNHTIQGPGTITSAAQNTLVFWGGNALIKDATITNTTGVAIRTSGWGGDGFTIENSTITGKTYGFVLYEKNSLVVKSGTISATNGLGVNGEFMYHDSRNTIRIGDSSNGVSTTTPVITGISNVDNKEFYDGQVKSTNSNLSFEEVYTGYTVQRTASTDSNGNYTYTLTTANYGEYTSGGTWVMGYSTLNDAFTNMRSGNTIKPLSNRTSEAAATLASGKTAILDLNGKTVTMTGTLTNNGNLTISGSGSITSTTANITLINNTGTLTKNGTSTISVNASSGYAIQNTGRATLSAGTISANLTGTDVGCSTIRNTASGKVTINGATVEAHGNCQAINCYTDSTGTTSNPDILISSGNVISYGSYPIVMMGGLLYATGGTIKHDNSEGRSRTTINCMEGAKVQISGATIQRNYSFTDQCIYNAGALTITSGTITSNGLAIKNAGNGSSAVSGNGELIITGGTITSTEAGAISTIYYSTVRIGTSGGTPSTTNPSISGATFGIQTGNNTADSAPVLSFYDGVIKGSASNSIIKYATSLRYPDNVQSGYVVKKYISDGKEVAVLASTSNVYYEEYSGSKTYAYYTTLYDALGTAKSGNYIRPTQTGFTDASTSTITVPSGKTLKLNLNGKTINLSKQITNNGTLDIYNTSSTEGIINSSASTTIKNSGTLTLNGTSTTNKTTINNTTTAPANRVLYNDSGKTATLNTNSSLAFTQSIVQPDTAANRYLIANYGALNVQGASLINTTSGTKYERCITNTSSGTINTPAGTITAYGIAIYSTGTSTGTTADIIAGTATPAIKITGTVIKSTHDTALNNNGTGTVFMNGGSLQSETGTGLAMNKGSAIIDTGSTIEGVTYGIQMNSSTATSVIVGREGGTPSTTNPKIQATGSTGKGISIGSGSLYFYDGVVKGKGAQGNSITGSTSSNTTTQSGYVIQKTYASSTDTAILVASSKGGSNEIKEPKDTPENKEFIMTTIEDGKEVETVIKEYNWTEVDSKGNVVGYFDTLENAVKGRSGNTIVAKDDMKLDNQVVIPENKSMTIDLNGKTVEGLIEDDDNKKSDSEAEDISVEKLEKESFIVNKGKLTIIGKEKSKLSTNRICAVLNKGELIVGEDDEVVNEYPVIQAKEYGVYQLKEATIKFYDGTIKAKVAINTDDIKLPSDEYEVNIDTSDDMQIVSIVAKKKDEENKEEQKGTDNEEELKANDNTEEELDNSENITDGDQSVDNTNDNETNNEETNNDVNKEEITNNIDTNTDDDNSASSDE